MNLKRLRRSCSALLLVRSILRTLQKQSHYFENASRTQGGDYKVGIWFFGANGVYRRVTIENKINTAKTRFGCGEIDRDVYETVLKEFEPQRKDLQQKLEVAQINLSNYSPYVDYAVSMSCKLGGLWKECDMVKREKLQNLVFPEGVFYDKKMGAYRTPQHNTFFHAISTELRNYKKEKRNKSDKIPICPFKCG